MDIKADIIISNEEMAKQDMYMHLVQELRPDINKKYMITTFGCQMNENDSEKLAGMLEKMGYKHTDNTEACDLILFNTCCVRENAELKVYGHIGALKALKRRKPDMVIALCGCMMQQQDVVEHIQKKCRHVDLIFGTHNIHKLPELLYETLNTKTQITDISSSDGFIAEGMPIKRNQSIKASLTIMFGCNNFCSYCIIPYVRGRERSRKPSDILNEAKLLGCQGFKEIMLLGQNVNSFGRDLRDGSTFASLLRSLEDVDGISRIRFLTSHPKDLSDELILAIRDCSKVCEHLHLPIQSGSNTILHEMNRKYTREYYFNLVEKIRKQVPNIALTTDIIVGFPGETEEDFEQTLDLVQKVKFDYIFTFLYSKRTGTPAAKKQEQVPEEIKKKRFNALNSLQNEIGKEINERMVGKSIEVLVDGLSKNSMNMLGGRTRTNKIVNFKGDEDLMGRLVNVKIESTGTWSLEGTLE